MLRHLVFLIAISLSLLNAAESRARWTVLNQQAGDAIKANDYAKLRTVLTELTPLLPGNQRVIYNLAVANAKLGDTGAALAGLHELTGAGLTFDFAADEDFASLRTSPGFKRILDEVAQNKKPVTHAGNPIPIARPDIVPEDVAYDAKTHRIFVSSVRKGHVYTVEGRDFATAEWGTLALAIDAKRRLLWASAAWLPHCETCVKADQDKTALFAFDLDSGKLKQRVESPVKGLLGDMTISKGGDIYVSEGIYGAVLRLRAGAKEMERLDTPGDFPSPQNPALSADEKTLYIADYVRGIASMNLATHQFKWLTPAAGIVVTGIDGFYVYKQSFLAVQNGTTPPRIVRFSLDLQSQQVLEANSPWLGEPTHGTVLGNDFYFLANTGWSSYDGEGKKKSGAGPVVSTLRVISLSSLETQGH